MMVRCVTQLKILVPSTGTLITIHLFITDRYCQISGVVVCPYLLMKTTHVSQWTVCSSDRKYK